MCLPNQQPIQTVIKQSKDKVVLTEPLSVSTQSATYPNYDKAGQRQGGVD